MPQEHGIDRAVLVGLHADCFSKEETATNATLDELEALREALRVPKSKMVWR